MGNQEDYEKKLKVISTIEASQIKTPHHIPVAVYIQEANTLYHWALADKEALTAAGLSWELVEDIPLRCEALIKAQASWQTQRNTGKKGSQEWNKRSPLAYDLRNRLLHDFRFAFRDHPDLVKTVSAISKGESHADMIQDLSDLSVLGKENPQLLEAINFDISLLDEAAQTASEMAALLAEVNSSRQEHSEAKKFRDQAYTHLKEAVDETREYGQYVFRKNEERFIGYRSSYIKQVKSRQPRKPKRNDDGK
jgi:hypothetical protein